MGRRPNKRLSKGDTDSQEAHEKMLSIANYYRNVNQNYNEILPHTSQNDNHQKIYSQSVLERVWRKENPPMRR